MRPSSRRLTVIKACLLCLATCALLSPPPATAVAIVQLPLPSTSEPASLAFSWPGGIIIAGNSSIYAYEHVTVKPFTLTPGPSGDEIRAATIGPNGTPWYVGSTFKEAVAIPQIGELSASALIPRYSYPPATIIPSSIALGADGTLWLAAADSIERYVPGSNLTSIYARPTNLVAGPDGSLWFNEQAESMIGRVNTDGEIVTYPLSGGGNPFQVPAEPMGMTEGPEGNLWIAEQNLGRIGRLSPSGELREFPIPLPAGLPRDGQWWRAEPRYIAAGGEGDIWFTDPGTESVGRVTPSGEITEYRVPLAPKGDYRPGNEGYLVPNDIVAISGGLLFTETDAKALGLIEPAASPAPGTNSAVVAAHPSATTLKRVCVGVQHRHHPYRKRTKTSACLQQPRRR